MTREFALITMLALMLPAYASAQDSDTRRPTDWASPYQPSAPFSDSIVVTTGENLDGATH